MKKFYTLLASMLLALGAGAAEKQLALTGNNISWGGITMADEQLDDDGNVVSATFTATSQYRNCVGYENLDVAEWDKLVVELDEAVVGLWGISYIDTEDATKYPWPGFRDGNKVYTLDLTGYDVLKKFTIYSDKGADGEALSEDNACVIKIKSIKLVNSAAEESDAEEIDITADLYHTWEGFDETATVAGTASCVVVLGEEVAAGGVVYGNGDGSVKNTEYADLTGYSKIVVEGVAGGVLRIMMNRQADNTLTEKQATIGTDGRVEVDVTDYDYVHLNCIKVAWGSTATVTKLQAVKEKQAEPADPRYTKLLDSMFKVWDGVGADAQPTSESPYFQSTIGQETAAGGTVYGNANVVALQYADITGYDQVVFKGTPGITVRLLLNRPADDSNDFVEILQAIDADGNASVDISDLEYAHLNVIKLPWSGGGKVESVMLFKEEKGVPQGIEARLSEAAPAAFYDLQGRRVSQPAKGIYVRNGKKVFVR